MSRAQLFVGRLPIDVREQEVEQVFDRYGHLLRCDVKYGMYGSAGRRGSGRTGMAYAFVDFDDRRDAEDAIKYENGRKLRGHSIVVEWARGPSYRSSRESYGRSSRQTGEECYKCRRTGHWARNCPEGDRDRYRSRYRSRSRSPSYRRRKSVSRSRSRSRDRRRRRRSSSGYRRKSRSPSRDKRMKREHTSRSITPAKSASRSRSRSHGKSRRKERPKKTVKSESRSPERRSHSRSHSPEYSQKPDQSPPRSPADDYIDRNNVKDENNRSMSRSPPNRSRSPSREPDQSENDSGRSVSRSRSR